MEILALETVFLLLAAFLAGCLVGHLARGFLADRLAPPPAAAPPSSPPRRGAPGERPARKARGRDDLTLIKGIGPAIQKKLNRLGIKRFEQIAGWDPADVAVIDQRLAFGGRIERENWIAQARKLAGSQDHPKGRGG